MNLAVSVSRICGARRALEKTGSSLLRAAVSADALQLWGQVKKAAESDPRGAVVGASALALREAERCARAGLKLARPAADREAFAVSLGCAVVVDQLIEKKAAAREITQDDSLHLHALNAEAALRDLEFVLG
jgi:hypothetical protein